MPQNQQLQFDDLCLKITTMVFGLGLKTMQAQFVGCATKSMGGHRRGTRVEI
jgi:hypothetical protein